MNVTKGEIKFIVRCVLDYLAEKRATFEPTGIAFNYPGMSAMKRVTVYIDYGGDK